VENETHPLSPDQPLWRWAEEAISHRAHEMLKHLDGVRAGEDIEAVHDMRVGSRRVVAAMRVFHPAFPGRKFAALMRQARGVTRRLGAVRDLDVLIDHFQKPKAKSQLALLAREYLLVLLRRERERARKPMLVALDRLERAGFEDRVDRVLRREEKHYKDAADKDAAEEPAGVTEVTGTAPFRDAAPVLLRERLAEYAEQGKFADQPAAKDQLHALRIKAKWLRYTMELFAPAYPDELKEPVKSAKRIQELLGDLHDADVRLQLLDNTLAKPLDADALVELSLWLPDPVRAGLRELRLAEQKEREGIYRSFYKEWKKDRLADFRSRIEG
jgi:CHAD domain-containing protein